MKLELIEEQQSIGITQFRIKLTKENAWQYLTCYTSYNKEDYEMVKEKATEYYNNTVALLEKLKNKPKPKIETKVLATWEGENTN